MFDAAGAIRGPLIGFQTWKAWSPDCRATTVWRGRMINPTTVVVKWVMTYGGRQRARRGYVPSHLTDAGARRLGARPSELHVRVRPARWGRARFFYYAL